MLLSRTASSSYSSSSSLVRTSAQLLSLSSIANGNAALRQGRAVRVQGARARLFATMRMARVTARSRSAATSDETGRAAAAAAAAAAACVSSSSSSTPPCDTEVYARGIYGDSAALRALPQLRHATRGCGGGKGGAAKATPRAGAEMPQRRSTLATWQASKRATHGAAPRACMAVRRGMRRAKLACFSRANAHYARAGAACVRLNR
jgi:hypothetical protein